MADYRRAVIKLLEKNGCEFVRPHNWQEVHLVLGYEDGGWVQTARFNTRSRFKEADLSFARDAARHQK